MLLVEWEKSGGKATASFRCDETSSDSSRKLILPPLPHALWILWEHIKQTEHGSMCTSPKQEMETLVPIFQKKKINLLLNQ